MTCIRILAACSALVFAATFATRVEAQWSRIRIADDGDFVVLLDARTGRAGYMRPGDTNVLRLVDDLPQISDVFPMSQGRWIAIGTEGEDGQTILISGNFEAGRTESSVLNVPPAAAAHVGDPGLLYLADGGWPVFRTINLCDLIDLCRGIASRLPTFENYGVYGPPIRDFVVDPGANLTISTHWNDDTVRSFDTRFGKTLQEELVKGAYGPMDVEIALGTEDGVSTVFLSAPEAGTVSLLQIDPDFQEWRPTGTLDLGEFTTVHAPITVALSAGTSTSGDGPSTFSRVATSNDQSIVLIGGRERTVVHALRREGKSLNRVADLRADGAIVDFDVTADGQWLAILTTDGVDVLNCAELSASNVVRRDEGDAARLEAALTSAVQRRLVEKGFLTGVVDGAQDVSTLSALDRYAAAIGLPASERTNLFDLPPSLLGPLFEGALSMLPEEFLASDAGEEVKRAAFATFFERALRQIRYFSPAEVFQLGGVTRRGAGCARYNAYPPEEFWPNLIPVLRDLDEFRDRLGTPLVVTSAFQTPQYSMCAGTPLEMVEAAGEFRALAFIAPKVDSDPLAQAAQDFAYETGLGFARTANVMFFLVPYFFATDAAVEFDASIERLGEWHALIASHSPDAGGCRFATDDAVEFQKLLSGGPASGLPIYIARTGPASRPDVYIVTVDTGSDAALAAEVAQAIRSVARRSADRETGADSFYLSNSGWRIDEACRAGGRIH